MPGVHAHAKFNVGPSQSALSMRVSWTRCTRALEPIALGSCPRDFPALVTGRIRLASTLDRRGIGPGGPTGSPRGGSVGPRHIAVFDSRPVPRAPAPELPPLLERPARLFDRHLDAERGAGLAHAPA